MFYSQCLLSRKGPLGAIWVAAYCFKRLKKAQVKETDISSSVDKILQDEINDQTYRVLAYLLLGVVRIYSKKVEYLFHDCNEVLFKLKKFTINTKRNRPMETLCTSVTLPDRFELDAFDLEVVEDVGGGSIAPREAITLKDIMWKNERIGQFSLDKYQSEVFDCFQNTCSTNDPMVEEAVNQSHKMDINFEVTGPNSPTNLQAGKEIFQECTFSSEKQMTLDTDLVVEVPTEIVNLFSQDKQIGEEQMTVGESYEDEVPKKNSIERIRSCRISQEDIRLFCQGEEDLVVPVEPFNESHPIDEGQIEARQTARSKSQMHQEVGEVLEARNSQASVEWIEDGQSYQEERIVHDESSVYKDKLKEHIKGSNEENHKKGKLELQENVSIEGGKFHVITPKSINIDVTPESRFHSASVARPKPGATMPECMLIPTPAAREGARFTRKRKFTFDDLIVLPNEVMKQSIYNGRGLISKRRKCPHTPLKAWRASRISSLPEGFHDSLLPCHSLELQLLFSRKKMQISESLKTLETPRKFDESESHVAAAPKTPRLSTIQSVESPDNGTSLSPHESMKREQSLRNDEEPNLMKEENNNYHCNVGTLSSYETREREQSLRQDEELNLMNEDSNSFETENTKSCAWTGQTRKVAMHLQRIFLSLSKQRKEEVVNFSQVFGAKTRKECARLFYEILVLKTTSCVDVKQNDAYGDISIRKLPKLDQTFGVDGF